MLLKFYFHNKSRKFSTKCQRKTKKKLKKLAYYNKTYYFCNTIEDLNGLAAGKTYTNRAYWLDRDTHQFTFYYRELFRLSNGVPSHLWLGGLQRRRTLKTCFSEFHHITSAPFSFFLYLTLLCSTRSASSTSSVRQRMRFL